MEPGQKKLFGPFHTYPGLKRDAIITLGLVLILLVLKTLGG